MQAADLRLKLDAAKAAEADALSKLAVVIERESKLGCDYERIKLEIAQANAQL